jgi:hypothetical protein
MRALRHLPSLLIVTAVGASLAAQSPARPDPPAGKGVVVIRAARLIDGTGRPPMTNAAIVVTDDRITAVGAAATVAVPAGARVIDLGDATLLPGFIDAHTHLVGRVLGDPDSDDSVARDLDGFVMITGVRHASLTL